MGEVPRAIGGPAGREERRTGRGLTGKKREEPWSARVLETFFELFAVMFTKSPTFLKVAGELFGYDVPGGCVILREDLQNGHAGRGDTSDSTHRIPR